MKQKLKMVQNISTDKDTDQSCHPLFISENLWLVSTTVAWSLFGITDNTINQHREFDDNNCELWLNSGTVNNVVGIVTVLDGLCPTPLNNFV